MAKEHQLQTLFHKAAELVGYEGGAFIFIDTGATGAGLEAPLHKGPHSSELRPGGTLRFTVIDPVNVFPGDYNSASPLSSDYFKPRWWWVLGQRVHASRLIRMVANEVPVLLKPAYNFLGIPQAQILWDYVLHFQECRAASVRLLTKFSLTVFKTKMDDILFASGGTAELDSRIRYMIQTMNNDGVLAVDKESEDVVKLETPLAGVTDTVRQSLEFLAALNRTPAVKLLGVSPSGFNATGESDIRNYYDHIASQQEKVLRDGIRIALECLQLHSRGEIDESVTFDFAPLGEEDRVALSAYQKSLADTTAVYLDRQVIAPEEARAMLADDPDSGFSNIDPNRVFEDEGAPDDENGFEYESAPFRADIDDVDKAGAVYDAARDEEIWRTAKNGKRFQVETETGEIVKGNVGQTGSGYASRPLESTTPDTARYDALLKEYGDYKKAAHAYFRENLQGRHVEAQTDNGTARVCFTGGTWQELKRDLNRDGLKAELIPHMPDIISTGQYQKNELHKERRDGSVAFHEYRKKVETSAGAKEVIVDVAEKKGESPSHVAYNLTREGSKNYTDRKKKAPTADSGPFLRAFGAHDGEAVNEESIAQTFEVVNMRFAGEEIRA